MRSYYPTNRYSLIVAALVLLSLSALVVNVVYLSGLSRPQGVVATLEQRTMPLGCQYSVNILAFNPPSWIGRVWELRIGGEARFLDVRAYRNGHGIFVRGAVLLGIPVCGPIP